MEATYKSIYQIHGEACSWWKSFRRNMFSFFKYTRGWTFTTGCQWKSSQLVFSIIAGDIWFSDFSISCFVHTVNCLNQIQHSFKSIFFRSSSPYIYLTMITNQYSFSRTGQFFWNLKANKNESLIYWELLKY